jgi:hypothetical protein
MVPGAGVMVTGCCGSESVRWGWGRVMFVTEVAATQNGVERPGTKQVGGGHGVRRQKRWRVRKLHRGFLAKSVVRMESSWVGGEKLGSRRRNKLLRTEEKKKRRNRRSAGGGSLEGYPSPFPFPAAHIHATRRFAFRLPHSFFTPFSI